jgi:hypothetical protein
MEAAQHYMELHAPSVEIGGDQVKIAYSLGRGEEDNGWTCEKVDNLRLLGHCLIVVWTGQLSETTGMSSLFQSEAWYHSQGEVDVELPPSSPPKALTKKAWVYNDGEGDVGITPSQFVLVRKLDTMLQEETIYRGLCKLETSPKRILLIRDRKTKVSWGFAFAEYQDVSVSLPTRVI